jgi:hypothetical protein
MAEQTHCAPIQAASDSPLTLGYGHSLLLSYGWLRSSGSVRCDHPPFAGSTTSRRVIGQVGPRLALGAASRLALGAASAASTCLRRVAATVQRPDQVTISFPTRLGHGVLDANHTPPYPCRAHAFPS